MQARAAYAACMQYTLRNVPPEVDAALRARARSENKSLNEIAIEALTEAVGLAERGIRRRDLSDIAGSWKKDRATEAALEEQRAIDQDSWR